MKYVIAAAIFGLTIAPVARAQPKADQRQGWDSDRKAIVISTTLTPNDALRRTAAAFALEGVIIDNDDHALTPSEDSSRQFSPRKHTTGRDGIDVLKLAGTGFVNQFTTWNSVLLLGATGGMTYLLSLDERHQQDVIQRANVLGRSGEKVADITGVILNFPVLQVGGYFLGRATRNEKLVQFTMDVLATHVLTLVEVSAISQIPFHKRPNVARGTQAEGGGGINDILRGASSFPSGHLVGISVLMFKSWEYYGWKAGIPATIATALMGWARIESGDHYPTDVLGAVALSGIASLSTTGEFDLVTKGIPTSDGGRLMVRPAIGASSWGVSVTRTF
jgi:membrane-associated phospholipid phosphatase